MVPPLVLVEDAAPFTLVASRTASLVAEEYLANQLDLCSDVNSLARCFFDPFRNHNLVVCESHRLGFVPVQLRLEFVTNLTNWTENSSTMCKGTMTFFTVVYQFVMIGFTVKVGFEANRKLRTSGLFES